MDQLLTLLFNGLSLGCVYALIAIGFVVVFKATRGAQLRARLDPADGRLFVGRAHDELGFPPAVLAGIAAAAVADALVERVIMRRCARGRISVRWRSSRSGVDVLLLTELTRRLGTDVLSIGDPWGADVVRFGDTRTPDP